MTDMMMMMMMMMMMTTTKVHRLLVQTGTNEGPPTVPRKSAWHFGPALETTHPYDMVTAQEHMLSLESCLQTCMIYTIAECTVNKLLMMDRRTVRNM